jgi:hypothetical protein
MMMNVDKFLMACACACRDEAGEFGMAPLWWWMEVAGGTFSGQVQPRSGRFFGRRYLHEIPSVA